MATSTSGSASEPCASVSLESDSDKEMEESRVASSGEGEPEHSKVMSLLDQLKLPSPADVARPRKTKSKVPRGKCKCRGILSSDPKGVSPTSKSRSLRMNL